MAAANVNENVRYEPNERAPSLVALGAGAQAALITLAPIVLTVVIVVRIADGSESYISWAAFAALVVSGVTTVMQAVRVGRIGSGHILIMGTSGAFIAVCVAAHVEAGPSTMASLVVISSLFQFLLAARLSLLRRIFTPVVSGTVIMLIAATVMPIVFDTLGQVPRRGLWRCRAVGCGLHTDCGDSPCVTRASRLAIVGAGHRDSSGLCCGRALRSLRHRPSAGGSLGWCAH